MTVTEEGGPQKPFSSLAFRKTSGRLSLTGARKPKLTLELTLNYSKDLGALCI